MNLGINNTCNKRKVVNESGVMPQLDDCCYFGVKQAITHQGRSRR